MPQKNNWQLQDGFKIEKVVSGLSLPVNIAFVPGPEKKKGSPLFYVTELYGKIKAVTNDYQVSVFAEDLLNYEPDFKMPGTGESGRPAAAASHSGRMDYISSIFTVKKDSKKEIKPAETSGK